MTRQRRYPNNHGFSARDSRTLGILLTVDAPDSDDVGSDTKRSAGLHNPFLWTCLSSQNHIPYTERAHPGSLQPPSPLPTALWQYAPASSFHHLVIPNSSSALLQTSKGLDSGAMSDYNSNNTPAFNQPPVRTHPSIPISRLLSGTTHIMSTKKSPSTESTAVPEAEAPAVPSTIPRSRSTSPARQTQPVQPASPAGSQHDEQSRIRNAAAQARHRAKRKQYVAQLEKTVANLRETLKLATNSERLKQLEEENTRLTAELQYLQAHLEGSSSSDDGSVAPMGWPGAGPSSSQGGFLAPPGMGGAYGYDEEEEFDPVDPSDHGLKGWSPAPQ